VLGLALFPVGEPLAGDHALVPHRGDDCLDLRRLEAREAGEAFGIEAGDRSAILGARRAVEKSPGHGHDHPRQNLGPGRDHEPLRVGRRAVPRSEPVGGHEFFASLESLRLLTTFCPK
jgi:hypothetical protein